MLALALTLVGVSAAGSTANNQTWADALGDNQKASESVYASDIVSVSVDARDNGDATLSALLDDGPGRMVGGDQLSIFLNTDGNNTNGVSGFDLELRADGQSGGAAPTFTLCRYNVTPRLCEEGISGFGADQNVGGRRHVVSFGLRTGLARFTLVAISAYTYSGTTYTDVAPNSGVLSFETNADPDHDGVYGSDDKCMTVPARGVSDSNHNGCPGIFSFIRATRVQRAVPLASFLRVQRFGFTGQIPARATVSIRGGGRSETFKARGGHAAESRRFRGALRYGTTITAQITKPGFVGVWMSLRVTRAGIAIHKQLCIPAFGNRKPRACSLSMQGS